MARQRIAIVHPWANLDSVPSLFNAVELLAAADYAVDVYTRVSDGYVTPTFAHDGVEIITPWDRAARKGMGRLLSNERFGPLCMWQRHLVRRYRCVIAVDPGGLYQASLLGRFVDVPVVYYSLELLLSHELGTDSQRWLKQHELPLSRQSALIIIQDEQRARLMAEDNGIEMERFVHVPNSPVGPARRRRSDYWHRRFKLSSDKRVVLHAGSIDAWTGIEDIVASTASWPKDCVLVVHTRGDEQSSAMVERLRKLAPPDRVFFSLTPVPRQAYDELIDGADMGIVFYVPIEGSAYTQENIRTIGLSSGKIGYYLRAGLPVVVNRFSSIGDVIDREGCGVAVEDGRGVAEAMDRILGDYETFSRQACRLFDERLDFARSWRSVIDRIERLDVPSGQATWRMRRSYSKTMQPA